MQLAEQIQIGSKAVGDKNPVFIIAEVGSNHNGSLDLARKHIAAAAAAGVDAVKFQAFTADKHYSRHTPGFSYLEGKGEARATYDLIKSLEIDREWHEALIQTCRDEGVEFLSSPCDDEAVTQLASLGMNAFKLASFDLPDLHLIARMAKHGRPLLLSTGMANMADIQNAVQAAAEFENNQIVLFQCTSLYPAPAHLSNLNSMATMHRAFGAVVGYSDHTLGDHVCLAAVACGASILEKHFTLDRSLPGPDHGFAIEPDELKEMVRKIREVESAIGDGRKSGPREEEMEMFAKGRRSLHTIRAVQKGEVLTADNLQVKRPGYGLLPVLATSVVGLEVKRDLAEDHWITWEDLK